jgi:hypothetical protein
MWNERIMVQCEPIFPYLREGTEKIRRPSDHNLSVHFPFRALWYWVHFVGLICNNDMLCPSQYLNQASPYYERRGITILNASNSLRESSRIIIIRAVLLWQDKLQGQKKAQKFRLKKKTYGWRQFAEGTSWCMLGWASRQEGVEVSLGTNQGIINLDTRPRGVIEFTNRPLNS